MNVALFGGFGKRMLASGWTKQSAVAVLGGGELDLTNVRPGENARLTAIAFMGGVDIVVDDGSRVTMTGFTLFGNREVKVVASEGPPLHVRAIAIFGAIEVKSPVSR